MDERRGGEGGEDSSSLGLGSLEVARTYHKWKWRKWRHLAEETAIVAAVLGFFLDSGPPIVCAHQRDHDKAPTCFKQRCLSHHACLCDARFDG
jgi:hypothetical protein